MPQSCATPEIKLETAEGEQFALVEALRAQGGFPGAQSINDLDGVRVDYVDGFGLARPSNTTPTVVLRFEGDTMAALARIGRTSATPCVASRLMSVYRSKEHYAMDRAEFARKRRKPRDCWTAPNGAPSTHAARCAELDAGALKLIEAAGLSLDLSMQRQSPALEAAGLALLRARGVPRAVQALFAGEAVNWTEDKPAWHTALRAGRTREQPDGQDAGSVCEYARMLDFVRALDQEADIGAVLHIGIGGSDWGPRLAVQAFGGPTQRRQIRFVSNIDGHAFNDAVTGLDPRRCLVVVSSVLHHRRDPAQCPRRHRLAAARRRDRCGGASGGGHGQRGGGARAGRAGRAGVLDVRLGGRPLFGMVGGGPVHRADGGRGGADRHAGRRRGHGPAFPAGAAGVNAPAQLALAGLVNCSVLGHNSLNIAAYSARLLHLVTYLQQLEMESLGKRVAGDGQAVGVPSAPIIWGMPGTDGQHTFFQWLHQSENGAPVDFIASLQGCRTTGRAPHAAGQLPGAAPGPAARQEPGAGAAGRGPYRRPRARAASGAAHGASGGRPSSLIVLRKLDPRGLGALLALYEHKVFVQSVVWGINPFDQWGVELGKRLATGIERELAVPVSAAVADRGTTRPRRIGSIATGATPRRRCRAMPGCRASRRICERRQGRRQGRPCRITPTPCRGFREEGPSGYS